MGKSTLFDNLIQVIAAHNTINGTTKVSTEIDLELPRGYVAKIRKIKMEIDDVAEKWAASEIAEFHGALVLDPDDILTIEVPNNQVQHDVIAAHNASVWSLAATGEMTNHTEWINFEDKEDVITARNMRWNTVASGVVFDDAFHEVTVYYTLEKIQDAQIMELLDIL